MDGPGGSANGLMDALAVLGGKLQLLLFWHHQWALSHNGLRAALEDPLPARHPIALAVPCRIMSYRTINNSNFNCTE